MAELAEREWADFQEIYVPVENALIAEVQKFGSPERVADAQAQAQGAVHQATAGKSSRLGGEGAGQKFGSLLETSASISAGLSGGATAGRQQEKSRASQGKLGLINVGRGVQALGSAGISRAARDELSTEAAGQALKTARRGALMDVLGTAAGIGVGYGLDKWMTRRSGLTTASNNSIAGAPTASDYRRRINLAA